MGKRALVQALDALDSPARTRLEPLTWRRLPFQLRPEREGEQKWLDVLRKLGVSRGDTS